MSRSRFTLDLAAVRDNVRTLRRAAGEADLWAVVKADGYGHGAADVGRAALEAGATALCVASVAEATDLRRSVGDARLIVLGPSTADDIALAREARVELVVGSEPIPEGVPIHLKLDTGMGRWGLGELATPARNVVGLMSHLAAAESDAEFTRRQIDRFHSATAPYAQLTRHLANSAATLGFPDARFDAVRCGIAVYGISPWGDDPAAHDLRPTLSWTSALAQVKLLAAGESTGYGRKFVAQQPTWIGLVPVGYADGFRRDLSGTDVLVGEERCRVVGTVSMDAFAVQLPAELPVGERVTMLGDGLHAEEHARVAGTIAYEIVCGLRTPHARAARQVIG
jgi:alanine racemase